jgi:hypothetical protein
MKYYSPLMNPAHDILPMFAHFILMMTGGYIILYTKEFPVFKPNEYFWKNHWDEKGGEQKWEAYMNVIRNLMAQSFDFKLSDLAIEDKAVYKSLL